jgi:hypothetical protein
MARNAGKQLGYGVLGIVAGLVLLLIYFAVAQAQAAICGCAIGLPVLLLGGIGLILVGMAQVIWNGIRLVVVPVRGAKIALCPFCQRENRVLKRARRFLCQQCGRLLVLSEEGMQPLQATECPHCHRPMGVASDAELECLDCGVTLRADTEGKLDLATKGVETCAECGQPSPIQARFCGYCGNILPHGVVPVQWEPAEEEMILRSEIGNLRYSIGRLQGLCQKAVDGQYAGKSPQRDLTSITRLFRRLTSVIDGFEDALRDPSLKDEVTKQLPLLNQTYGALLLKLHAELLALVDRPIKASCAQPFLSSDDAMKYIPMYMTWDTYEWVKAQHALVERMRGARDKTTRRWGKDLIGWRGQKGGDVWWMKAINVAPLLEEARKIAPDIVAKSETENWFA